MGALEPSPPPQMGERGKIGGRMVKKQPSKFTKFSPGKKMEENYEKLERT